MPKESYVDGAYRTFVAHTPGDLIGKEFELVEIRSDGLIQLADSAPAIGVLYNKLEGVAGDWTVRMLGKGGTVKVKAGGAIDCGARVKASGSKAIALGASGRSLGTKISPTTASADNDIIEIIDVVENVA